MGQKALKGAVPFPSTKNLPACGLEGSSPFVPTIKNNLLLKEGKYMPNFEEMLELIIKQDCVCQVCKYSSSCHGLSSSPNGPSYPVCANRDYEDYIDEDSLKDLFMDITGDEL